MRKTRSKEYCHNCQEYSEWVFEQREGNQIIECPLCSHLHYRVVDGSYIDFEIEFRGEKIRDMNKIQEILKENPESEGELKELLAVMEFGTLEDLKKFEVSHRRWGQDPSQAGGWSISATMTSSWSTSTTSYTSTGSAYYFTTSGS